MIWTFVGKTNDIKHPYYEGTTTLYIDPVNYAMRGRPRESKEIPGAYILMAGELEINGIKIPQVTAVYRNEDNSHWYSDVFTQVEEDPATK